ncbi:MAG: YqgE/AlgH family protein [Chitinophagaceae bacterium]|nr:YqgE/AlgH family protein [Chitinophagaceae bacterium]
MCEHNQDGCVGFVLNRLYEYRLDELNVDFKGFPIPIYYGGPVEMTSIHFIHQYPDLIPDAIKICDDIYWGGNFETLTTLIKNRSIDLNKLKIFIGYSGWDKNQLEDEIKENTCF